jgi:hypothetical protein
MARAACGKPLIAAKVSQGFNLFGLRGLRELADT